MLADTATRVGCGTTTWLDPLTRSVLPYLSWEPCGTPPRQVVKRELARVTISPGGRVKSLNISVPCRPSSAAGSALTAGIRAAYYLGGVPLLIATLIS